MDYKPFTSREYFLVSFKSGYKITHVTNKFIYAANKITNLDGIQYFPGATSLILISNELTSIDLTNLVNLTELNLNNNWIGTLDLTKNIKLTTLSYNASSKAGEEQRLTKIDLTKNTELVTLTMQKHELESLDLSKNTKLKSVDLKGNTPSPLTISQEIFDNLTTAIGVIGGSPSIPEEGDLYVINNKVLGEYLNYRLKNLNIITVEGNTYKIDKEKAASYTGELNLSKNGDIPNELEDAGLSTAKDKLTDLDGIQFFTGITSLTLVTNNVTEIDVSALVNLETLDLNNNKISSLDVTKNTKLKTLRCKASTQASDSQKLITIDLSKNLELTTLDLVNNKLESIDLSKNTKLTSIKLSKNPGAPFTIPAEIYDNLSTIDGVQK